jgi:uncharacterized membrane protein YkoI
MRRAIAATVLATLFAATTVHADDDDDHERARRLQSSGVIVPIEQILTRVQASYPEGKVLEIEFKEKKKTLIYELEILDRAGIVRELHYDARSGELLKDERED